MLASEAKPQRWGARIPLAVIYAVAGAFHLTVPDVFVTITPAWVPKPHEVIIVTGLCELAGAAALLTGRTRAIAGIALAAYAVCVYPANIKHAIDSLSAPTPPVLGWWYHAPRLALQPVLVWWALYAGGLVTWPFSRRREGEGGS
ncbi:MULTISPECIES: DoxX family protein [Rhizobium]|nr:DoxX family protein [Rhizobium sp. L51/94]TQX87950.1 hypothetical protein EQW76_13455 [Rhizobium sp. rho-13.1]TQY14879.1 hypothetical protein EQW74_10975 [Rhizobium sp. rho-1.1]